MAVLQALRRNPVLFVPVLLWTLVQVPSLLLREVSPALAGTISPWRPALLILATPFVHAGLLGMADEALDGGTSLKTFVREGKDHYAAVLAVYLLLGVGNTVAGIGVLTGGALVLLSGTSGSNPVSLVVVGGLALALLAYLLVLFFVQFYGHAITIEDRGPVAGLKRSAALVRRHWWRTLRYSVVGSLVGILFAIGLVLSSLWLAFRRPAVFGLPLPQLSTAGITAGTASIVLLQTLVGGAFATYSVAFYHAIDD